MRRSSHATCSRDSPAPRNICFAVAALALLAIASESSGFDLIALDALYDAGGNDFVLRNAWWTKKLLHDGGQDAIRAIAVGAALVALFGKWLPRLRRHRRAACYVFLTISLSALGAGIGKSTTNIACPWDLGRYGGERPYVKLLEPRPTQFRAVRCFPGGHASGGFALLSLFFVAGAYGWRRPRAYLLIGIGVGTLFSATQWLRGAHFPSHDLWTAAGSLMLSWLLFRYAFQQRLAGLPGLPGLPAPAAQSSPCGARVSTGDGG